MDDKTQSDEAVRGLEALAASEHPFAGEAKQLVDMLKSKDEEIERLTKKCNDMNEEFKRRCDEDIEILNALENERQREKELDREIQRLEIIKQALAEQIKVLKETNSS
jgi:TolA-binding protein